MIKEQKRVHFTSWMWSRARLFRCGNYKSLRDNNKTAIPIDMQPVIPFSLISYIIRFLMRARIWVSWYYLYIQTQKTEARNLLITNVNFFPFVLSLTRGPRVYMEFKGSCMHVRASSHPSHEKFLKWGNVGGDKPSWFFQLKASRLYTSSGDRYVCTVCELYWS